MRRPEQVIVLIAVFIMIFPALSIAGLMNLPQTGQIACYNQSGTSIPCTGTGQDGDIRAGVPWPNPRFVDNLDGTITDKLTGLMWLQDATCFYPQNYYGNFWNQIFITLVDFNLHPENYHCRNYTATYNDWRVPNIIELESLPGEGVSDLVVNRPLLAWEWMERMAD